MAQKNLKKFETNTSRLYLASTAAGELACQLEFFWEIEQERDAVSPSCLW